MSYSIIPQSVSVDNVTITKNASNEIQVNEDGFVYVDNSSLSNAGTTETLVRTYTFNRAVEMLKFTTNLRTSGTNRGELTLYKNGVQISNSKIIPVGQYHDTSSHYVDFRHNSNYLRGVSSSAVDFIFITVLINESFSITDTFEIKLRNLSGGETTYTDYRIIEGKLNGSTTTTWITLS